MKVWIGFAAFCFWAGSAWLYDVFAPGVLTGLPRSALHNGVVAAGCLAYALWRREPSPSPRAWVRLAAAGFFLFALPDVVIAGALGHASQSSETLVFTLVPVVVVFWVGQQSAGFGTGGGALRGLFPALAGLGGAALILPFAMPTSLAGRLWMTALVASAIMAGIAAVAAHRLLVGFSIAQAGSAVFGVSCLAAAAFSWIEWTGLPPVTSTALTFEWLRILLIDAPILLLGLWLLRAMRPVAFSSRLLLVPAVTLVEGILAERPEVGWYGWLGLSLVLAAAILLLRSSETSGEVS
jgi:drug/metabolite transporter (DMT)-like permease